MVFIILKSASTSADIIKEELYKDIANAIGKWALPTSIIICDVLPKE